MEERTGPGNELAERESPEFSNLDTSVDNIVRVYETEEDAVEAHRAWAEPAVLECLRTAADIDFQELLDSGDIAPATNVDFTIERAEEFDGDPRVIQFQTVSRFTGPEPEIVIFTDVWYLQAGRTVSRVSISNPEMTWLSTSRLLDTVATRLLTTGG